MRFTLAGFAAESVWVYPTGGGRLVHQRDGLGNRIPDFSNVGYRGGAAPIPDAPVRVTIAPVAGDDGDLIQAALDQVSALPMDANGMRGAVLLTAGEYQIADHVEIRASGVVLRGVGDSTGGTVLRASGPGQRTLVRVSGSGSRSTVGGTTHNVTDKYVPVGARAFTVDSVGGLAAGDRVIVKRPSTQAWIDALGMDLLENPWTPGSRDIQSDRVIMRLEGNRVFLDAPLVCALEQQYGGGQIWKYTWSGRLRNSGVEGIRGVSDYAAADDEDHGWTFVEFRSCEDCWARGLTSQYFGYACVGLLGGAQHVTVADCQALDPVSQVTGGRRYAFVIDDAELCLVRNCYTRQDRHQFVTQSNTDGPNAFVDGLSDSARSDAGPHHRWATGALWDHIEINGQALDIQNRGNLGTGHGWAGGNCVAWNCDASSGFVVQNPPTARNWLVGSVGSIKNGSVYVGPHDPGTYDAHGANVFPQSLYWNQLQDRLAAPGLQLREFVVGDFDDFSSTNGAGDAVSVDALWLAEITARAGGAANVTNFDNLAGNKYVAWTHTFALGAGERVEVATLWVAVRGIGSGWATDQIFLESTNRAFYVTNFAASISPAGSTVLALDLATNLALLADGKLNLAVQDDLAVDWSALELRVAPAFVTLTNALTPVADALVRGGTYAGSNFGAEAILTVKGNSDGEFDRRALLRWNVSSVAGRVIHATVRLVPTSVGAVGMEHAARFVPDDAWSEAGVTWNNQPAGDYRFASFMPTAGEPVELVVTPQVLDAIAGDGGLSLQIFSTRDYGGSGLADYGARENATATSRPQLILVLSNSPPQISDIQDRFTPTNSTAGLIPFTIGDGETAAGALTLRASCSNTNLVPLANIALGGGGSNRTVSVTHSGTATGAVTITVFVSDGALTNSDTFRLNIGASNSPPVISNLPDRAIAEDTTTGPIAFTIGDRELSAASLTLSVACSDTNLVPLGNIAFGGSASNRTVTLMPAPDQSGAARITVTVSDGSLTTNDAFTLTVTPVNDPPDFVALTSPADGALFDSATIIPLAAIASDPDGNLARVDFFANGSLIATDSGNPFGLAWPQVGAGNYTLTAVAVDGNGASITSAPARLAVAPAPRVLVPLGTTWRYLDTGVAPPANWMALGFNDDAWASGAAELGYGDDDETTEIRFGPSDTNKFITTWFRHTFSVTPPLEAGGLLLRMIRDDGAVAYLNGAEIFRSNMPTGAVTSATRATSGITGSAETNFIFASLPLEALVAGSNQLAVEIHQNQPASSDLSFNLEFTATNAPATALVATGGVWRYLDTGAVPPANWTALAFDDSAWPSGPAPLGYGDGDEATLVFSNRLRITTYFRHTFVPPALGNFAQTVLRLLRDDGAVVYLNGREIFRSNLPNGPIDDGTFAVTGLSGAEEDIFHSTNVNFHLLLPGTNVIAAEVHQNGTNSSDLSFEFALVAYPPQALPRLDVARGGGQVTLTWPAWAGAATVQSATTLMPPVAWTALTNAPAFMPSTWSVTLPTATNGQRFYRVQAP